MLFNAQDRARIAAAIAAAEAATAGEIVVIVNTRPQRYPASALAAAVVAALALPFIAVLAGWSPSSLFPDWDVLDAAAREAHGIEALLATQAAVLVAMLALIWGLKADRLVTPPTLRRDRVHEAAQVQFRARGLAGTQARGGLLIYVDEPEHVAEVIADEGIFTRVGEAAWAEPITALIAGIKAGRPADGMIEAIGRAGAVLARVLPPTADDRNELPDCLIEL